MLIRFGSGFRWRSARSSGLAGEVLALSLHFGRFQFSQHFSSAGAAELAVVEERADAAELACRCETAFFGVGQGDVAEDLALMIAGGLTQEANFGAEGLV